MAESKLESFFKDLLTLEVTTVVVDAIPPEVLLDLKQHVAGTGQRMLKAGRSAAPAGSAGSAAAESAGTGAAATSVSSDGSPPEPAPPSSHGSLKAMFETIAQEGAKTKADLEQRMKAVSGKETAFVMSPALLAATHQAAAENDRRIERATVLAALLPATDAEMDDLPEERRVALRRVVTLADHPIALHTTISVSGDITTLCARKYTDPSEAAVRALHAEGTSNAIGWWKVLADGITGFLKAVFDAIGMAKSARPGGGTKA